MPRFAQLFKDTSPPLIWSDGWVGGSSATDSLLDKYSQATYTVTQKKGANMTFSFNGTMVGIYGAKRPGHGLYQIKLDNHLFPPVNASSDTPLFNQTLFQTNVEDGFHTVTLINAEDKSLDVDYVYFEGNVGKKNEDLIPLTFQDNDSVFSFSPRGVWGQSPRPGTFSASTGTITNNTIGKFTYKFEADVILLYGTVTPTSTSAYMVSVDDGPWKTFSARKASVRPHQVLYYASNLGRGVHTLKFKFAGTNGTAGDIAIDFANLYTTKSLGGKPQEVFRRHILSEDFNLQQTLALPSSPQYIPKSIVAGLSITSVIAFFALMSTFYLLWAQRRQKNGRKLQKLVDSY